ncbi:unnamed protein product [Gadus morhua 'NCC']
MVTPQFTTGRLVIDHTIGAQNAVGLRTVSSNVLMRCSSLPVSALGVTRDLRVSAGNGRYFRPLEVLIPLLRWLISH